MKKFIILSLLFCVQRGSGESIGLSFIPNGNFHYIGETLEVECRADDVSEIFAIELFCPWKNGEKCFETCSRWCSEEDCPPYMSAKRAKCQESLEVNSRSIKYTFYNITAIFGENYGFKCKFGTKLSNVKTIDVVPKIKTTNGPTTTVKSFPKFITKKKENEVETNSYRPVKEEGPELVPDRKKNLCSPPTGFPNLNSENEVYLFLSRNLDGRIFVCIVGLLVGSTLLMLLCCLRCLLIRKCSKGKGRICFGGLCCMKKEIIALRQMRQRTVDSSMPPYAADFYPKKILGTYGDASDHDRESSYMMPQGLSSVSEVGIPPVKKSDTFSHYSEGMNYMGNHGRHVIGASFSEVGHESGQRTLNRSLPQGLQLVQMVSPNNSGSNPYPQQMVLMSVPIPEQRQFPPGTLPMSNSADNNTIRNYSGKISESGSESKLQSSQGSACGLSQDVGTEQMPPNTVFIPYPISAMNGSGEMGYYHPATSMYMPAANLSPATQKVDKSSVNNEAPDPQVKKLINTEKEQ